PLYDMSEQEEKPFGFTIKSYIESASECNVIPSFSEFVRLNADFIVRSSTKTSDLQGLEGAWAKRFDLTARILNTEESIASGTIKTSPTLWELQLGLLTAVVTFHNIGDVFFRRWGASVGLTGCGFTFPTSECCWGLQLGLLTAVTNDKADWYSIFEKLHMVGYKTYVLVVLDQPHCDLTCDICQIQISESRREKTYIMYSNENEHFGNKLMEDQKKSQLDVEKKVPNNPFIVPGTTGENDLNSFVVSESNTNPFRKNYGFRTPPHQIVSNTYDQETSINENILRMSAKSLAELDESKYFADFIPHFIRYKELQKNNPYSQITIKKAKKESELPEDWCNVIEDYFKETTESGSIKNISDWICITEELGVAKEKDNKELIKIKNI
ncbi:35622_t:CDS:2, partial [Racocetra persica]